MKLDFTSALIVLLSIQISYRYYLDNKYIWNILIAIDQFFKVLVYGGNPDVTISHVIGLKMRENRANIVEKKICCVLRFFEHEHCKKSIEEDEIK